MSDRPPILEPRPSFEEFYGADAVAVTTLAGGVIAVLSDGAVIRLADDPWELLDTLEAQCPLGVDAHGAGKAAYAILCGDVFVIDGNTAEAVPDLSG